MMANMKQRYYRNNTDDNKRIRTSEDRLAAHQTNSIS